MLGATLNMTTKEFQILISMTSSVSVLFILQAYYVPEHRYDITMMIHSFDH
jgi:hypothetical protein